MNNFSKEHAQFLKNIKQRSRKIMLCRILILSIFLILWEIFAFFNIIDPFITSSPSRIFRSFLEFYEDGTLFFHTIITTNLVLISFFLSSIIGILISILLWLSDFVYKVLEPFLIVLNALPKVALAPIIIFWVGNGSTSIIIMGILISVIVTIINILTGFKEVDIEKINLLKTFNASKFQILTNLIIPANRKNIIATLKINIGLSFIGVIMGEFLVANSGLGFLIIFGGQISRLDMVMMSIIIIALLSYIMYMIISFFEKKLKY